MDWQTFINERMGVYGVLMLVIALQTRALFWFAKQLEARIKADQDRIGQLERQLTEALDLSKGNTRLTTQAIALAHETVNGTNPAPGQEVVSHGPSA